MKLLIELLIISEDWTAGLLNHTGDLKTQIDPNAK